MCGLRPGSAVTNDHNVDEGRESAFSVAHRICCSKRRMSDSASTATTSGPASSSRTQSMTPRAGRRTGTSSVALHLGWRMRSKASSMRVWLRSRSGGPVVGYSRMRRSEPSAMAIRLRTSLDGRASPRSISQRWAALTSDARARRRSPIPASSRCRRMSDPIARCCSRATAAARRWISVRPTQARVPVCPCLALIWARQSHRSARPNETRHEGLRARASGSGVNVAVRHWQTGGGGNEARRHRRTRFRSVGANRHAAARRAFRIAVGSGAGSATAGLCVVGSVVRAQGPAQEPARGPHLPRVGRAARYPRLARTA